MRVIEENDVEEPSVVEEEREVEEEPLQPALPIVAGNFGTKISAVVSDILQLFSKPEPARIILFSQFEEVLKYLSDALTRNDVSHFWKAKDAVDKYVLVRASFL